MLKRNIWKRGKLAEIKEWIKSEQKCTKMRGINTEVNYIGLNPVLNITANSESANY